MLGVSPLLLPFPCRLHDSNQSGSIDFNEFSALHTFLTNMRSSFRFFDRDRSGQLDLNEIGQALQRAGYQLDQHAFYATVKAFDPDRTGTLGEPEFIALTLFLQSAKGMFSAFDPTGSGTVTFNFAQFVYAAANTR
jgi:Ca2+-binding EF-hand superfamily protein